MSMDLLPTLVDFAVGAPTENIIDGISFKSLLLTGEQLRDRDLFWSFKNQKAMRRGTWKLVSTVKEDSITNELFDLNADLSEQNDLSDTEPEITKDLLHELDKWNAEVREGITVVAK
jgi:arylsulfatase A-like enzyme